MARLYEVDRKLNGSTGQSELARRLNTTPQRVKNWEARGISLDGAIEAQRRWGVNATWVLFGEGAEMVQPGAAGRPIEQIDPEVLSAALRLVRMTLEATGTPHEPEKDTLATVLAYAFLVKRNERNVSADNIVDFSKYLRARRHEGADTGPAGIPRAGQRAKAHRAPQKTR
jgi:hypothetical protein